MKIVKILVLVFSLALLAAALIPSVQADQWNKKTVVTFNQPVEIPGQILPAGTYTFALVDSLSDRHIVRILDKDGIQVIATILAIPNLRLTPTGDTVMKFSERPGDAPEALKAWFYPGDNFGQEFVYPKSRALQLAQVTKEIVPAIPTAITNVDELKTAPIVAVTPDQKEVEVSQVAATPPPVDPAPVPMAKPEPAKELPQTNSSMPLIALLGTLSLSLALGLKMLAKQLY